jgi:hypothetical protein
MRLTSHEVWALVHGMLLGGTFLLSFAAGLYALVTLRAEALTPEGVRERVRQLKIGTGAMALMAWTTVITGTWVILPWYRAEGGPKSTLLSDPETKLWHEFADVWKTHVAWTAPLLATAAAVLVAYYGQAIARDSRVRRTVLVLFVAAFSVTSLAALIGSLVTRAAPIT